MGLTNYHLSGLSRPKMETHERKEVFGPFVQPKRFVLCFDGTGNKFAGDESDTNLVKIYRVSICVHLSPIRPDYTTHPLTHG